MAVSSYFRAVAGIASPSPRLAPPRWVFAAAPVSAPDDGHAADTVTNVTAIPSSAVAGASAAIPTSPPPWSASPRIAESRSVSTPAPHSVSVARGEGLAATPPATPISTQSPLEQAEPVVPAARADRIPEHETAPPVAPVTATRSGVAMERSARPATASPSRPTARGPVLPQVPEPRPSLAPPARHPVSIGEPRGSLEPASGSPHAALPLSVIEPPAPPIRQERPATSASLAETPSVRVEIGTVEVTLPPIEPRRRAARGATTPTTPTTLRGFAYPFGLRQG
jgi:hypothetical protein